MICAECHASNQDSETCLECGASPLLLGRFRLLEQVGAGASGTTYRAERLEDGRLVAVKEMLMRRADSLKALELFEREAKILERLEHPGIPAYVEDFVHEAGRSTAFYLVQDFVEGKPISERMRHPNTTEEVLKICDEVLEILTYLHSFNPPIIHRDVKPENIIERPDGSLALVDFGSVRAAIDSATGGSTVAGTFGFMAPEQLLGRALPQTDVYAVGALAVALLTGKSPDHFTQNDRSIDLSALKLPDGLRHSLLQLLNPAEQSRPDAAEARLILRNTPTSSMVLNSPVSVTNAEAEVDGLENGLALKSAKERFAARAQIAELEKQQELQRLQGTAVSQPPETLIGPATLKEAFRAYLQMPTPRPVPKSMALYLGISPVTAFLWFIALPFLICALLVFHPSLAPRLLFPPVILAIILLVPGIAVFFHLLLQSRRSRLVLAEGDLETATITAIRTNDGYSSTTVHYRYQGNRRGSTQFKTAELIADELAHPRFSSWFASEEDRADAQASFGVKVGDDAHVLVHPSDPNLSKLMLVAPPKFNSKLLEGNGKVPLLEDSGS